MLIQTIDLSVKNLPYKKMPGYLKSQMINPVEIAVSIADDGKKYVPIDWKNYLPFGHKVVKIILCKMDTLFLFVGFSNDGKTIIYSDGFSKQLLCEGSKIVSKTNICNQDSSIQKNKFVRLNELLDKIKKLGGIDSLTKYELNELDYLSRQNLK